MPARSAEEPIMDKMLGHYRIIEEIGAGGMGVVYRAKDERLDRDVALKVLPAGAIGEEQARKRFRKEALALAKLNHPNVQTIHDFDTQGDTDFLVTEYVPGKSLEENLAKGPLPEKEVLRLGSQLALGLAAAHEQGIVHRDLKPSNLRVTPDGHLKVLDFGLATLLNRGTSVDVPTSDTVSSTLVGTLPYMAPEQLRGAFADVRSDIYAAGAVLYEIATGRRLFSATEAPQVIASILSTDPVAPRLLNPRLSPSLQAVILKALDKEPDLRYQSARELYVDLERLATPSSVAGAVLRRRASVRHTVLSLAGVLVLGMLVGVGLHIYSVRHQPLDSLAVLPFSDAANSPDTQYLCDGITDTLIDSLSQMPKLRVMAPTTVYRLKGQEADPQKVGKALGVQAVLTGRVFQREGKLDIQADLVDVADGSELWGVRYNRQASDILALQEEIAHEIANKLRLRLTQADQTALAKHYTEDSEAYELYLKGRYYSGLYTLDGINKGITYFNQAAERDAGFALAYVGLANAYHELSSQFLPPRDTLPKMAEAARKALTIDPSLGDAHTSLALVKFSYEYDFLGAEREFQRAIDLNPGAASTHQWYGYYLIAMGRQPEALRELYLAQKYDPLSPEVSVLIGLSFLSGGESDRAIQQFQKALDLEPNFWVAHHMLGMAYMKEKRYGEARNELAKATDLGGSTWVAADVGYLDAISGRQSEALKMLQSLLERSKQGYVSPHHIAGIYVGLGQKDRAFEWLEKAYQSRDEMLVFLKVDPKWETLRPDPRFQDLLHRLGL